MKVAVLGLGTIGKSWVSAFLNHGFQVSAWDPDTEATAHLLAEHSCLTGQLTIADKAGDAVNGASFVQENAPENLDLKRSLYASLQDFLASDAIVASSTSTVMPSDLQKGLSFTSRVLIGHPFNPPHIIPLVEVVGGQETGLEAIERAVEVYRSIGRTPVRLKRERSGHLANRIQAAVWREAVDAVASGQASVEEVDLVMTTSLGPRWATMGPFATFDLGGGPGGLVHFLNHLGGAFEALWKDLKDPTMTAELVDQLVRETQRLSSTQSYSERIARRDGALGEIFQVQSRIALP